MKRFLFYLSFFIPLFSLAQSNFQKGYVVTNSKDTLKGYIDYRERQINPSSVSFKSEKDGEVKVFHIGDCAAYSIDGLEKYDRFAVDITMSNIALNYLSKGPDLTFKRDTVWLKVLQTGKNVTLYSYSDKIKTRFYIKDNETAEPVELIRQLYMKEDEPGVVVSGKTFNRQLLAIMSKFNPVNGSDKSKFEFLKYDETSMIKASSLINVQQPVKSRFSKSRFFAGAGLNISHASYNGTNDLANDAAVSKSSYAPLFSAGIDLFANPAIGKLIYRAQLSLLMSKNEISTTTDVPANAILKHSFDQYTVALTPQVIYNLYNTNALKAFLGVGVGLNFSKYSNNQFLRYNSFRDETDLTEDLVKLDQFNFSVPVTAGVVFNKKIEVSASYAFPSSISNYNDYNIAVQRFSIGINYLFGKN